MTEPRKELQEHVYEAVILALKTLVPARPCPGDPQVHGHIAETDDQGRPTQFQPPYYYVGEITAEPAGGKGDGRAFQRITIEIITVFRGPKRAGIWRMQSGVYDVLDEEKLASAGAELGPLVWISTVDALQEDGITYDGSQIFETLAQYSDEEE